MWALDANAFFWWKIMNIWICISYTFTHVLCFTFSSLKSSKKTTTPHPPKKPMSILSNKFLLTLPESNIAVKINGWEMKFLWEGRIFRCKLLLSGRVEFQSVVPSLFSIGMPKVLDYVYQMYCKSFQGRPWMKCNKFWMRVDTWHGVRNKSHVKGFW